MAEFLKRRISKAFVYRASALALVFLALVLAFPKTKPLPKYEAEKPTIYVGDVSDKMFELARLNDSEPLFLPTNLNFGAPVFELPRSGGEFANASRESPMEAMKTFEVSFSLKGSQAIPMEFFAHNRAFADFMRVDSGAMFSDANAADAQMEIFSAGEGRVVGSASADLDFDTGGQLWSPVKITLVVAEDGAISPPLIASGSGLEDLDAAIVSYLKKNIHTFRLKQGMYVITFSP